MKNFFTGVFFMAISVCAHAQVAPATTIQRSIRIKTFGSDSVNVSLNENYQLIEDSCAAIIREAHFNAALRKYTGKFTDVSKTNPSAALSTGTYDDNGLKTGEFIVYNLDGSLRAKGSYQKDKFDGKWQINYSDGKPALTFTAKADTIRIESAWDDKGKKITDNGKGAYSVTQGSLIWKGKVENGKPDGTWHLYNKDDVSETSIIEENFKKGLFQKGTARDRTYTDVSHINLISADWLPYLTAEKLLIAPPCNSTFGKHIVWAQYKDRTANFAAYVFNIIANLVHIQAAYHTDQTDWTRDNTITITGNVSEKGELVDMKSVTSFGGSYNGDIGQDIIRGLHRLPLLEPATVEGKPVKQGFRISVVFKNGSFTTTYQFLPIKA